jgi:protein O-GlcNAc transferase
MTTTDYRITDPYLDPPGLLDRYYSERSIRLPDTFWCYDPLTSEPPVNSLPAIDRGHITFGSFNNFCKVNDAVVRLWARVLRATDCSRLMMLAPEGSPRKRVLNLLEYDGVASDRITFVTTRPRQQYLELYREVDIVLDTCPYNGHTTSLDSFWMGVPVVTIVCHTVVGRAGLSLLSNLGLPDLIAHSAEEYVHIAANLASDVARLGHLRARLRERMLRSPLMDAPRFARNIEAAYQVMWETWCAGRMGPVSKL